MITLIACKAKNNVIGKNGNMPWHIKEDFIHFKNYTMNKKVLMGKNTFISLNCKPLPKRTNIVLTTSKDFDNRDDIIVINSLEEILNKYKDSEEELVVMGGAKVYEQALPYAKRIVLSELNKDYDGDTYFPILDSSFKIYKTDHYEEFNVNYYKKDDE